MIALLLMACMATHPQAKLERLAADGDALATQLAELEAQEVALKAELEATKESIKAVQADIRRVSDPLSDEYRQAKLAEFPGWQDNTAAKELFDRAQATAIQDPEGAADLRAEILRAHGGTYISRRVRSKAKLFGAISAPFEVDSEAWLGDRRPGSESVVIWVYWWHRDPHSKNFVPALATLHRTPGVQVVGLTSMSRSTPEGVANFARGLAFPSLVLERGEVEELGFSSTPSVVLVADGVLRWVGHPAQLEFPMLDQLLAQP